jgi:hypothetical protein
MGRVAEAVKSFKFPLPLELLKWLIVDLSRVKRKNGNPHLYGIWCFVGQEGGGKTMSLVHYLERMRKKYGDSLYIATNFFYKGQDFPINRWEDILVEYDRNIIFGFDEMQNDFSSRDYKSFPPDLIYMLTQNRKGLGKQIVYTTQDYDMVDIIWRRYSRHVVLCKTIGGRLTRNKVFLRMQYEAYANAVDINKKLKIRPIMTLTFVQTDELRDQYDTFAVIESAKRRDYISRQEAAAMRQSWTR